MISPGGETKTIKAAIGISQIIEKYLLKLFANTLRKIAAKIGVPLFCFLFVCLCIFAFRLRMARNFCIGRIVHAPGFAVALKEQGDNIGVVDWGKHCKVG